MSARAEEWVDDDEAVEEVDAVAVAVVSHDAALSPRSPLPRIAQAAAVAVTGFAAGAVTAAVVHRTRGRKPQLPARRNGAENGLAVSSSRRFIIDVHELVPRA